MFNYNNISFTVTFETFNNCVWTLLKSSQAFMFLSFIMHPCRTWSWAGWHIYKILPKGGKNGRHFTTALDFGFVIFLTWLINISEPPVQLNNQCSVCSLCTCLGVSQPAFLFLKKQPPLHVVRSTISEALRPKDKPSRVSFRSIELPTTT